MRHAKPDSKIFTKKHVLAPSVADAVAIAASLYPWPISVHLQL